LIETPSLSSSFVFIMCYIKIYVMLFFAMRAMTTTMLFVVLVKSVCAYVSCE
jgi:hypothetical protein